MKKVLLTLLVVIVTIGALAGVGFTGYRMGYRQGALTATTNTTSNNIPFLHPDIPMQGFGRNLDRGFGHAVPGGFGMRGGMMRFGFFGPLMFLGRILFWALVIGFIYWLFTRSGWQLTRKPQTVATAPKVETPSPEVKET